MIKIKIIYLARLSEDLQKTEELLDFESGKSIRDLYDYHNTWISSKGDKKVDFQIDIENIYNNWFTIVHIMNLV